MKGNNKTLHKQCLCLVVCKNILGNGKQCKTFDIVIRLKSIEKLTEHQMIYICNKQQTYITRKTCAIKATFVTLLNMQASIFIKHIIKSV